MENQIFLCNIKYNQKRFKIFTNKYHIKSFLRILEDNTLMFPTLEEYCELDKIYNKRELEDVNYVKRRETYKFEPSAIYEVEENGKKIHKLATIAQLLAIGLASFTLSYAISNNIANKDTNVIICNNNDELRSYMDNKNPTFDDVKEALNNNKNITGKYKKWLMEFINDTEKNLPDLDLVCLYENIKGLKIKEEDCEQIKSKHNANTYAYFSSVNKLIVVPSDDKDSEFFKYAFEHECTHMITEYYAKKGDNNVIIRSTSEVRYEDNHFVKIYRAYVEGLTDYTRNSIKGDYSIISGYNSLQDVIQLFNDTMDFNIYDLLENNTTYVIDELKKNGISDPEYLIELMDIGCESIENNIEIEENIRKRVYTEYYSDLIEKWIAEGNYTPADIFDMVEESLAKGFIINILTDLENKDRPLTDEEKYFLTNYKDEQQGIWDKIMWMTGDILVEKFPYETTTDYNEIEIWDKIKINDYEETTEER